MNIRSIRQVCSQKPVFVRNYGLQTMDYETVKRIKETRFGNQLEEFKRIFEEPLAEAYNTVNLIKSTYANRQARYMTRGRKKKLRNKNDFVNKLTEKEKKLELAMHSYLKRDLDARKAHLLLRGKTKKQRMKREQLMRSFMTNERFREMPNDDHDPLFNHLETVPSHTKNSDMTDHWDAEETLELNQIAAVVAREVEARGFQMTTNWSDRAHAERERRWENPHSSIYQQWQLKTLDICLGIGY